MIVNKTTVGIDADTNGIGVCAMTAGTVRFVGYIKRKGKGKAIYHPEYVAKLRIFFDSLDLNSTTILLEDIYCKGRKSYRALAEVRGEIKMVAYDVCKMPPGKIEYVLASSWQSTLFKKYKVKGGDTKDRAGRIARLFTGVELNEHEADAICISVYGDQGFMNGSSTVPKSVPKRRRAV